MRSWMVFAILSVSLVAGQHALAASSKSREREAKKACLSGDYVKGVAILAELYILTSDSGYLFNQARCYEQNIQYSQAAERFREMLRKSPNLSDSDRADVEKHIADCVAAAKSQGAPVAPSQTPAPAQPPPAGATVNAAGIVPPAPQGNPATPTDTPVGTLADTGAPQESPWQHTAKWVATGAAAAFLVLGVVENARNYSKNSDYNNAKCTGGAYCNGLADAADTAKTWAIVGYSAAAAATAAAVVFWLTDSPRPSPARQAGLGLSCAPVLAGVSCQGSF